MVVDPPDIRVPQQDRSRRAVRRLLDAAESSFAEEGYERASVRDIAERAGVAKGSVYQFFRNKQALRDAVVAKLGAEVDGGFAGLGSDPTERRPVRSMVDQVIGRTVELAGRRPAFRTLFAGLAATGPLADAGAGLRERYRERIAAVLATADPPSVVGSLPVSTVCTEITRGLLAGAGDRSGRVDDELATELSWAVASYLESVRDRTERP